MLSRPIFLLFALCSVLFSFLSSPAAYAQQASWGLTNTSSATLYFETLDPARGTWKRQTIYANQSVNYTMSPGVYHGKFRIETPRRGFVEYQVLADKKYTIVWNDQSDRWDMKFAPGYDAYRSPNSGNDRAGQRDSGRQRGDEWQEEQHNNRRGNARENTRDNGDDNDQGETPYVRPPQYTSYKLLNASNDAVSFETLDPARGTWRKQDMYPNQTKSFTMSPGISVSKIRIATDGRGFVEYDMRLGWSYKIVFDTRKGVWDIRTVQRAP